MKTIRTFILATAVLSLAAATNIQGAVSALQVTPVSNWLALTITNPTPAIGDIFGYSVTGLGTGRVLIGAPNDYNSGVFSSGAAYLFSTNGALLTTFTNPTPAAGDYFGRAVEGAGTDRVLVGAPYDDTGASNAGAAYLFSTNGTLLTTFTNPTPTAYDNFGYSVAAVGTDRVLIGAYRDGTGAEDAGAAYLFSTNGTLLTIFTNPTPAFGEQFGFSVAAVGNDRVLIGALYDNTGAASSGAAYLFSTNGALLTTYTNPTPKFLDFFGFSVAAVGTDRVLIGACNDDTGATAAGAAYLFSTNGTLLTTFTNPKQGFQDTFGWSVAAVGTDRALIGAPSYNGGAAQAGVAYLFSLELFAPAAPSLSTSRNPALSTLTISWPAPAEGWLLERTNVLPSVAASAWPPVPPPYQTNAGTISVTLTNSPATGNHFFRLRQP